jgi:threonine/homoserine/homoserine lactone efflux protein
VTIENYIALFIAMFVVALIPGPAVLAITSASVVGGFKRGVYMAAGFICADYVFIILAVSGLSFLAETMGNAFVIIKYSCAAYLVWMGISLFTAKETVQVQEHSSQSKRSAMITGFLLTLGNPKAIMFYVALFPAFVEIERVSFSEVLGIMVYGTLAFGSVNLGYAYLAAQARRFVSTPNRLGLLHKCAGTVMAMSGVAVAIRA